VRTWVAKGEQTIPRVPQEGYAKYAKSAKLHGRILGGICGGAFCRDLGCKGKADHTKSFPGGYAKYAKSAKIHGRILRGVAAAHSSLRDFSVPGGGGGAFRED
jgi:hypothetical protein